MTRKVRRLLLPTGTASKLRLGLSPPTRPTRFPLFPTLLLYHPPLNPTDEAANLTADNFPYAWSRHFPFLDAQTGEKRETDGRENVHPHHLVSDRAFSFLPCLLHMCRASAAFVPRVSYPSNSDWVGGLDGALFIAVLEASLAMKSDARPMLFVFHCPQCSVAKKLHHGLSLVGTWFAGGGLRSVLPSKWA